MRPCCGSEGVAAGSWGLGRAPGDGWGKRRDLRKFLSLRGGLRFVGFFYLIAPRGLLIPVTFCAILLYMRGGTRLDGWASRRRWIYSIGCGKEWLFLVLFFICCGPSGKTCIVLRLPMQGTQHKSIDILVFKGGAEIAYAFDLYAIPCKCHESTPPNASRIYSMCTNPCMSTRPSKPVIVASAKPRRLRPW